MSEAECVGVGSRMVCSELPLVQRALAATSSLDRGLTVIDVGCRWGVSEAWAQLGDRVRIFGFDPDVEECSRLQENVDPTRIRFIPLALAATSGPRELHVTVEPACSSLYPPDDEVVNAFPDLRMARQVATETVEVTTLDEWAAREQVQPDFLKLDVQGADHDVLKGAEQALTTVRAMEVEVMFNRMYRDQPLFGDVDAWVRHCGFELWHLSHLVHYSRTSAIGEQRLPSIQAFDSQPTVFERRGGQIFWGLAYYVRRDMAAMRGAVGQLRMDALLAATIGLDDLAAGLLEVSEAP